MRGRRTLNTSWRENRARHYNRMSERCFLDRCFQPVFPLYAARQFDAASRYSTSFRTAHSTFKRLLTQDLTAPK
jgi:hypothetical protein